MVWIVLEFLFLFFLYIVAGKGLSAGLLCLFFWVEVLFSFFLLVGVLTGRGLLVLVFFVGKVGLFPV